MDYIRLRRKLTDEEKSARANNNAQRNQEVAVVLWTGLGVLGAITLVGLSAVKWLVPVKKIQKSGAKV